jgi:hypothetical protein
MKGIDGTPGLTPKLLGNQTRGGVIRRDRFLSGHPSVTGWDMGSLPPSRSAVAKMGTFVGCHQVASLHLELQVNSSIHSKPWLNVSLLRPMPLAMPGYEAEVRIGEAV